MLDIVIAFSLFGKRSSISLSSIGMVVTLGEYDVCRQSSAAYCQSHPTRSLEPCEWNCQSCGLSILRSFTIGTHQSLVVWSSMAAVGSTAVSTGLHGKPQTIWSDHGTNFVGASRELLELVEFLNHQIAEKVSSEFCSTRSIQ